MQPVKAILISIVVFIGISFVVVQYNFNSLPDTFIIKVRGIENETLMQIFFDVGNGFDEAHSSLFHVPAWTTKVILKVPQVKFSKIRIDPSVTPNTIFIESLHYGSVAWLPESILTDFLPNSQISECALSGGALRIRATGNDPQLLYAGNFESVYNRLNRYSQKTVYFFRISLLFSAFLLTVILFKFLRRNDINEKIRSFVKHENVKSLALALSFIFIIIFPTVEMWLDLEPPLPQHEKRKLMPLPDLSTTRVIDILPKFESYFNDNFGFRSYLIRYNNILKTIFLHSTPVPQVMIGKEGWLYYDTDRFRDSVQRYVNGTTFLDYRGLNPFTEDELNNILKNIEWTNDTLSRLGIKYILAVAPNKNTIYPEYLPEYINTSLNGTRLDQLLSYSENFSRIKILDLRNQLNNAKRNYPSYYKTDSHWNSYGAYIGYYEIMNELSKKNKEMEPLKLSDFIINIDTIHGMDLARMLAIPEYFTDEEILFVKKTSAQTDKLGKLVFIHDSFGDNMIPFLSTKFDRVINFGHQYDLNKVIDEKPDVVVHLIAERLLEQSYTMAQ